VHLDVDAVLLGEIAFAPLDRLALFGLDLPKAAWVLMGVLLLNIAFLGALYKELKLSTFDAGLAVALGFAPALLHYLLVGLVSVTAVAAFDAVGSVLVVALMIAPPATAYLLTDRLPVLLAFAVAIGAGSAAGGYLAAIYIYDTNIAGMMAVVAGLMFALALTFGPRRGLMAKWLRRRRQRWEFPANLLAVHLLQHEHAPDAPFECSRAHCREHFSWESAFTERVISYATGADWVREQSGRLALTPAGREVAVAALRRS
jgi:manganese/zinc/iron transport system permease protein